MLFETKPGLLLLWFLQWPFGLMVRILDPMNLIMVYSRIFNHYMIVKHAITSIKIYLTRVKEFFFPRERRPVHGHIAVVTGAGHGIGRHLAMQLVQLGNTVVCLDRTEEANQKTVAIITDWIRKNRKKEMPEMGYAVYGYTCDVTDKKKVKEIVEKIEKEVGGISILVNNAGLRKIRHFISYTDEQIEKMIDVNLMGQIWMTRAVLPKMLNRPSCSKQCFIVAMGAVQSYVGFSNMLPFDAAKSGVKGFMEGLFMELLRFYPKQKIHCMLVCPFLVKHPKIPEPGSYKKINPKDAAKAIIDALHTRENIVFLPGWLYYLSIFYRLLPIQVQAMLSYHVDMDIDFRFDHDDDEYDADYPEENTTME